MGKIITWNIRHGGMKKKNNIVSTLRAHDPNVIVLTEFRSNSAGDYITSSLRELGWRHQASGDASPNKNSVLIAAKEPFAGWEPLAPELPEPDRLIQVQFDRYNLCGVYLHPNERKIPYWEAIISAAGQHAEEPVVYVGDMNTGKHYFDEAGATFVGSNFMDQIEEAGFLDLWRNRNPEIREFTWYSPQSGHALPVPECPLVARPGHLNQSGSLLPSRPFSCSRRALGKPVEQSGFDSRVREPVASPDVNSGHSVHG